MRFVSIVYRYCVIFAGMGFGGWIGQQIASAMKIKNIKLIPVVIGWILLTGITGAFGGYYLGKKLDKSHKDKK